jgi:hypothetical protein
MNILRLTVAVALASCSCTVSARKVQWASSRPHAKLAAADAYTSLWKEGGTWYVDQDAITCGMIWLNQTSYARSTYRISSVTNTASCGEDEEVRKVLDCIGWTPRLLPTKPIMCAYVQSQALSMRTATSVSTIDNACRCSLSSCAYQKARRLQACSMTFVTASPQRSTLRSTWI